MKKNLALLLTATIVMCSLPALAANTIPVYRVDDALLFFEKSTGEITGFAGEPTWLTIPSSIAGYKVTSIGDKAFSNCVTLRSVDIPDSVNRIGAEAFRGCSSLLYVNFMGVVENIPLDAFDGTPWAEGQGESFVIAGGTLLLKYTGDDREVTVPGGVQRIAPEAFAGNGMVTKVNMPEGLIEIGDNAFVHCESLSEVNFPKTLSYVGIGAFDGTAWLKKSGDEFVSVNNILIAYNGEGGCVSVPDGITSVGSGAFMFNDKVTAVYLPYSVRTVNNAAFAESQSLKTVIFSSGIEWIDQFAFSGSANVSLVGERGSYAEYFASVSGLPFSEPITVRVNGVSPDFDVKPLIIDSVSYAPIRPLLEALGMEVSWQNGVVTAKGGGSVLVAREGETSVVLNGKNVDISASVVNLGGRVMLPVRAFGELLGADVRWDGGNRTVEIEF